MPESQFKALEQKIDDLISLCAELNQENVSLKADKDTWRSEREVLASRNELARHKVEPVEEDLIRFGRRLQDFSLVHRDRGLSLLAVGRTAGGER